MTDTTHGDLVKRLRESGSRSEVELHEDREEAADRIEELSNCVAVLEAKLAAMSQSREHFKRSAEKQRQRCHNLRHRQRALMAALQNVKDCTSIETAKFVAYIALGGWGDDELVYKSRTTLAAIKEKTDE